MKHRLYRDLFVAISALANTCATQTTEKPNTLQQAILGSIRKSMAPLSQAERERKQKADDDARSAREELSQSNYSRIPQPARVQSQQPPVAQQIQQPVAAPAAPQPHLSYFQRAVQAAQLKARSLGAIITNYAQALWARIRSWF